MNNREALKALIAGHKIRRTPWPKDQYIYLNVDGMIEAEDRKLTGFCFHNDLWEIYTEPKRKVKYAPAIARFSIDAYPERPCNLYPSEEAARNSLGAAFIQLDWANAVEVEE